MSQDPHGSNNVPNSGTGDYQYPPQSAQNHASAHEYIDGCGPILSMYLERAKEEDKKMTENWKADADGILIFTGLFSASVAALISVSIQDLRPNAQVTSNFYLANIYEAIADPNRANISTPFSPPPFSPPNYAVWVNALWFLSFVMSITCALLATLLQQWARRYLKVTQPHYNLYKRARIRSFFAEGVEKSFLPVVVEALPTLLHLSLSLFFAGLVVFLWNVDITIYKLVLSWVCLCAALYGCTTFIPLFRRGSPYYTPLTPLARLIAVVTLNAFIFPRTYLNRLARYCSFHRFAVFCRSVWRNWSTSDRHDWPKRVLKSISKTPQKAALESPSEIIPRAFMWTFDSLDGYHELDRFFSSLPGFRSSNEVEDPLPRLTEIEKERLFETLSRFLDLTFSSTLLPEPVKTQRAIMCAKALDVAQFFPGSGDRLYANIIRSSYSRPQTTNFDPIITNDSRTEHTTFVQAIVTTMLAKPQQRDDSWFRQVTPNALGVPETVLREYAAKGDSSLSLVILIHITRQYFTYLRSLSWPIHFWKVLEANTKFNAQDTSPELQREFCALWNQIVRKVQKDDDRLVARWILQHIRNVYISLHHDTDSAPTQFDASTRDWDDILQVPSSYPVCQVAGHVHDNSTSPPFFRTVLHDSTALVPASLSSLNAPSSSIPAPLRVIESPAHVPSLDYPHPAQATSEGLCVPVTSADLLTARDVDAWGIAPTPHLTPETSTSTAISSSPSPTDVALRQNVDLVTHSDPPDLPSLASSNPVLDNMLPTEFHPPIVTTPPGASPGMTFTPDLGAAAGLNDMV